MKSGRTQSRACRPLPPASFSIRASLSEPCNRFVGTAPALVSKPTTTPSISLSLSTPSEKTFIFSTLCAHLAHELPTHFAATLYLTLNFEDCPRILSNPDQPNSPTGQDHVPINSFGIQLTLFRCGLRLSVTAIARSPPPSCAHLRQLYFPSTHKFQWPRRT